VTTREAFSDIEKPIGGAFYLHGDDLFRKEEAVRSIVETHLDPSTRDFNLDPLRGTALDPETLASIMATPPMMANWRVVVIREVEGLASSKRAREALLEVVMDPPPGLALVMSCTVPKGSKAKFYRELSRLAKSLEFKAITDADVPGWLMTRASDLHGLEFDIDAARALGTAIGTNLGILAQELEKLSEFVGDKKRVTLSDVEEAGTTLPLQDRWEWFDLVAERRFEEARASLNTLIRQGETGVGLVIGLTSHLLRVGVALEQGVTGLESVLPVHQKWLVRRLGGQAKKWTIMQIDYAIRGLGDVDRLLKASPHSDEHFIETWIMGQCVYEEAA
jgi:DNA polymerase-3 subunit delta|tara:strand:+ start:69 stop:1070 length:1002 start_codon:yes stop_codon:yes gene_type:complete